jgi:membrane protein DedA with SNARE-associated domain
MSPETLISTYGYVAVGIGTFLEGETILVLAGLAAHRGYLDLKWVMVCAFFGTLLCDQLFFYLGRSQGRAALAKRPRWQARSERVFTLLERHPAWTIVGFRFLYGLRTVTPLLIGASRVPVLRFTLLNIVGAVLWAVVFGGVGYLFGEVFQAVIGDVRRYELWAFGLLALVGAAIWIAHWQRR